MNKSSVIFILLTIFQFSVVQAENTTGSGILRIATAQYSHEFKLRLIEKLENDPKYVKAYFRSAFKLLRSEKATNLALLDLNNKIGIVENKMLLAISKAGKLPDDTPVFLSKKVEHNYYAINGRLIPSSEVADIVPRKNITSWEDYVALYEQRKKYLGNKTEVLKYQAQTLTSSRKKIPDPDILELSKQRKKDWLEYKRNNL